MEAAVQIGEAARRTALTVDAIRFYEKRSLLPKPPRTAGRFRLYSRDAIARLDFIKQMQSLGFSLREVRQLLDLRERRRDACPEVRRLLTAKLEHVRRKIRELESLQRELALDLRKCNLEMKHRRSHPARVCPVFANGGGPKC